jgi:DNA-binding transcriptional ArsR family regulator
VWVFDGLDSGDHLDDYLSVPDEDSGLSLSADWSPAYELLLALVCFVQRKLHPMLELGPDWLDRARQGLPGDFVPHVKDLVRKDEEDLFLVLAAACPVRNDVRAFLDWFASLSTGEAYEAVHHMLAESGAPRWPRNFLEWRDRSLPLLREWHRHYFSSVDAAVLNGLRDEATRLRTLLPRADACMLVETVTNGLWPEPDPQLRHITLVPQFHQRPYNHHTVVQGGAILFYPADVLPTPPDEPPMTLRRLTHALSDESRLRILRFLAAGPVTMTEVARFAGLSQPTVHHHLVQLRAAGLVRVHFVLSSPSRYSLRPDALDILARQLGAYLTPDKE